MRRLFRRIPILLIPLCIQLLYVPLNHYLRGGIMPVTPFDDLIPLWPIWGLPYLLALPMWIGAFLWAGAKMPDDLFKAFVLAASSVMSFAMLVFLVFPTYVQRPLVVGQGFGVDLIKFIYSHDGIYNALPSGHVYITTLLMLFWSRWLPRFRFLWIPVWVVILLSTLFTRQHYLLDVASGAALAAVGYYVYMRAICQPQMPCYQPVRVR
jgi:membrane-associated phospholipid phosphatase